MQEKDLLQLIEVDDKTRLKHRENTKLEFKTNFNKGDFALYGKTLSAFANNQGGVIIFGVKDNPREAIGMSNDNFANFDNKDLANFLNEYFSPTIDFNTQSFILDNKNFGAIWISESNDKPIMCIKNGGKKQEIQEGEIYYRYSGRTQKIKYPELKKILDDNLELERQKWKEHIENIAKIGPKNVKMLDLFRGEIDNGNGKKIVVDKDLLKNLKLVEEGKFVEKDGAPALKLVGNIENGQLVATNLNLSEDFYTTKELLEKLGLKIHHIYFRGIVSEFKELQANKTFCQTKKNQIYYSRLCLEFLKEKNLTDDLVKKLCEKHKVFNRKNNAKSK